MYSFCHPAGAILILIGGAPHSSSFPSQCLSTPMMALGSEDGLPLPPIPSSATAAAVPTRLFGGGGGAGEGVCAACGGGGGRAPCPYCGAALAPPPFGHGAYYEAEDVSALPRRGLSPPIPRLQRTRRPPRPGDRPPGHHGSSPALPPWPSSPPPRGSRGPRGGGSRQRGAVSPEEVLRLFGPTRATSPRRGRREEAPPPPRREEPPQWVPPVDGIRTVTMDRPPDSTGQGFGICVKGGKEAGGGVYISRVEPGSVAERAGLRPGDSILQANGTPFRGITHEEALKMLKSCRTLSMTVESSPQSVQESIPMRQHPIPRIPPPSGCRYSWVDRVGRPVSPPPPVSVSTAGAPRSPPNRDGSIRKVELSIEPGQSLGLMIRGGAEYDLGVFVTGVDEGSAAERAGLKVGDQILEVNGVSFLSLSHDEAVHRLKHPRRMTLTVRDVGRVPHSSSISGRSAFDSRFASGFPEPAPYLQTTSDEEEVAIAPEEEDEEEEEQRLLLPWCASALPSSSAVDGGGRGVLGCPSLQMVEEKARRVLRKSEFATLAYYMREYAARRMAIDAFLAVLLEMLSTPEKYTLLTELREVVALEDRARFDELVYRREAEGQRCRELRQMLMAGNQSNSASRGLLAPSGRRHSLSGAECCHGLLVDGDGDAGADDQDHGAYDDPNMCGYLDGIRSHLGDWTQRVKSWYWGRPPVSEQPLGLMRGGFW